MFPSDTGAECTVLSLHCFETLPRLIKQKFQSSVSSVTLADGRMVTSKGSLLCQIEVGKHKVNEVCFVAHMYDFALLGWDTQLALGVQFTVAGIDLVG